MNRASIPAVLRRLSILLWFTLAVCNCTAQGVMRIAEPNAEEQARLNRGRVLVQRYLANDEARVLYQTVPGKLGTLRAIMKIEYLHPGRHDLLEALGAVLGDVFVQDMDFRWVALETGSGRLLAIRYRRTNIFLHPLELFAERIRRGERVDALDLYNDLAADVEEQVDEP